MSTEGGRAARRRTQGYRRTVLATVGVLALATTALGIAGAFRGPHLDSASPPGDGALLRAGQRLVIQADQAIGDVTAADVRVAPETPFEVASDGRAITVRFPGMLRALTDYTVSVDVTGSSTGVSGVLRTTFTTPDLDIAVLQRSPDGPDQVVRRGVAGGESRVVLEADRIQEFALTATGAAAVLLDEEGANGSLVLARDGETLLQDVPMPEPGRVQALRASETTGRVGALFTAADTDGAVSQLLLYDPLDASGVVRPVTGLDGEPVSVLDWRFVPGTAYLAAQTFAEALLLVDTANPEAPPQLLGEHAEVRGFLPGTLRLVVADPLAGATIDLTTGEPTEFAPPADGLPDDTYRGKLLALTDETYVEVVSRPVPGEGFVLDYAVLLVGPDGATPLYDPEAGVAVRDVCLSPNAQYVAVEVQDPSGQPDGYPNVSGRSGTTTYFVDLETGAANRGIAGFAASWCD